MDEKKKEEALEEEKNREEEGESEKNSKEDSQLRRAKIQRIKEMIERGEYYVSPEEIAEKILEFFKKKKS